MIRICQRRDEAGLSPSTFIVDSQQTKLDCASQIRAHFQMFKDVFYAERDLAEEVCQASFMFWTNNMQKNWEIVDRVRREYWQNKKPTSTFIETALRPDHRPWEASKVALEPVIWYDPVHVTDYYIEGSQFPPAAYCHAKKVETDESFELYFSGMCGVAGDPDSPTGIRLVTNTMYQQAHTALMYCNGLCKQANIPPQNVHTVDIFYCTGYEPATVVQQTLNFFRQARINIIPVTALFMPGVLVEIRPHATIWK